MYDLNRLEPKEWLELNAKLQQKKNRVRDELAKRGILKRGGENNFDHYTYFSEAQYKELFCELFSKFGLEQNFTEEAYDTFEGTEKQSNGRMPRIRFFLIDCETGFFETTVITGEGMDKGDKAGYKAYTGALKYLLADKFMVATGDDPEVDSPDERANTKTARPAPNARPAAQQTQTQTGTKYASPKQIEILCKVYTGENMKKLLDANGIPSIDMLPMERASELIGKLSERKKKEDGGNE